MGAIRLNLRIRLCWSGFSFSMTLPGASHDVGRSLVLTHSVAAVDRDRSVPGRRRRGWKFLRLPWL